MELTIDIIESSLTHKEMMATKMSCLADSLLLSVNVALTQGEFLHLGSVHEESDNFHSNNY